MNNIENPDIYLINKWKARIPRGWYGFSGVPIEWLEPIDNLLTEIEKECPDFEIHQVKLKFGGLRFYVNLGTNDEKLDEKFEKKISKLENICFDKKLIY